MDIHSTIKYSLTLIPQDSILFKKLNQYYIKMEEFVHRT